MTSELTSPAAGNDTEPPRGVEPARGAWRLWGALLAGVAAGVPVGWLLAVLILLPAWLGLFFYMLFGLLAGAVVYRVGRPAAPIGRRAGWALGLAVTFVIWAVGLIGEYYNVRGYSLYRYGSRGFAWYPVDGDATRSVRRWYGKRWLAPEQAAALREETRSAFAAQLREKYPPGGFVGFLRWSARPDRSIEVPRVFSESVETCRPPRSGKPWLVRLALSFVLLAGAVCSQTLGLAARPESPTPEDGDDVKTQRVEPNEAR